MSYEYDDPKTIIDNKQADAVELDDYQPTPNTQDDLNQNNSNIYSSAQREALALARDKNKNEWTATLNLVGNINLRAGLNIVINDAGVYSGTYFITECTHAGDGGSALKTIIKARKVLNGY